MKLKIKFDTDILALLIACLAVGMAFWEGYESRQHNRKSVMPIFNTYVDKSTGSESNSFEMGLRSVGLGPATIKVFKVFFNGREEQVYRAPGYESNFQTPKLAVQGIIDAAEDNEEEPIRLSFYENPLDADDVVGEEESRVLFKFESNLPAGEFLMAIDAVENAMDVFICYCSIYDDQCQVSHIGTNAELMPQSCKVLVEES